jgi:hypothetical protein
MWRGQGTAAGAGAGAVLSPSSAAISELVLRVLCDLSVVFGGLPATVESTVKWCQCAL